MFQAAPFPPAARPRRQLMTRIPHHPHHHHHDRCAAGPMRAARLIAACADRLHGRGTGDKPSRQKLLGESFRLSSKADLAMAQERAAAGGNNKGGGRRRHSSSSVPPASTSATAEASSAAAAAATATVPSSFGGGVDADDCFRSWSKADFSSAAAETMKRSGANANATAAAADAGGRRGGGRGRRSSWSVPGQPGGGGADANDEATARPAAAAAPRAGMTTMAAAAERREPRTEAATRRGQQRGDAQRGDRRGSWGEASKMSAAARDALTAAEKAVASLDRARALRAQREQRQRRKREAQQGSQRQQQRRRQRRNNNDAGVMTISQEDIFDDYFEAAMAEAVAPAAAAAARKGGKPPQAGKKQKSRSISSPPHLTAAHRLLEQRQQKRRQRRGSARRPLPVAEGQSTSAAGSIVSKNFPRPLSPFDAKAEAAVKIKPDKGSGTDKVPPEIADGTSKKNGEKHEKGGKKKSIHASSIPMPLDPKEWTLEASRSGVAIVRKSDCSNDSSPEGKGSADAVAAKKSSSTDESKAPSESFLDRNGSGDTHRVDNTKAAVAAAETAASRREERRRRRRNRANKTTSSKYAATASTETLKIDNTGYLSDPSNLSGTWSSAEVLRALAKVAPIETTAPTEQPTENDQKKDGPVDDDDLRQPPPPSSSSQPPSMAQFGPSIDFTGRDVWEDIRSAKRRFADPATGAFDEGDPVVQISYMSYITEEDLNDVKNPPSRREIDEATANSAEQRAEPFSDFAAQEGRGPNGGEDGERGAIEEEAPNDAAAVGAPLAGLGAMDGSSFVEGLDAVIEPPHPPSKFAKAPPPVAGFGAREDAKGSADKSSRSNHSDKSGDSSGRIDRSNRSDKSDGSSSSRIDRSNRSSDKSGGSSGCIDRSNGSIQSDRFDKSSRSNSTTADEPDHLESAAPNAKLALVLEGVGGDGKELDHAAARRLRGSYSSPQKSQEPRTSRLHKAWVDRQNRNRAHKQQGGDAAADATAPARAHRRADRRSRSAPKERGERAPLASTSLRPAKPAARRGGTETAAAPSITPAAAASACGRAKDRAFRIAREAAAVKQAKSAPAAAAAGPPDGHRKPMDLKQDLMALREELLEGENAGASVEDDRSNDWGGGVSKNTSFEATRIYDVLFDVEPLRVDSTSEDADHGGFKYRRGHRVPSRKAPGKNGSAAGAVSKPDSAKHRGRKPHPHGNGYAMRLSPPGSEEDLKHRPFSNPSA